MVAWEISDAAIRRQLVFLHLVSLSCPVNRTVQLRLSHKFAADSDNISVASEWGVFNRFGNRRSNFELELLWMDKCRIHLQALNLGWWQLLLSRSLSKLSLLQGQIIWSSLALATVSKTTSVGALQTTSYSSNPSLFLILCHFVSSGISGSNWGGMIFLVTEGIHYTGLFL